MSNKQVPRRGFSHYEMYIPLGVMAVLSLLLFPLFGRARENARRSSCQSNLKQMGLSFLQYAQDSDKKLPPAGAPPEMEEKHELVRIAAYLKNPELLVCRSDKAKVSDRIDMTIPFGVGGPRVISSYLTTLANDVAPRKKNNWGVFSFEGMPLSEVKVPSETIMATEGQFTPPVPGNVVTHIMRGTVKPSGEGTTNAARDVSRYHHGGANALFSDGHVKWFVRAEPKTDERNPDDHIGANATINGVRYYYFWRTGVKGKM
jgi:prepilin-type processing-associated H-X9-DG protein